MDIKKYILEIIKDEQTKSSYLQDCNIAGLSDDQKIYLIAKMLRELDEREADVKKFADNFDKIFGAKNPIRESILLCHMAIEHFMDEYLNILLPNQLKIADKPRFTFDQKLYLCVASEPGLGFFYKEIKTINKIRNKFAHNSMYKIFNNDLQIFVKNEWLIYVDPDLQSLNETKPIIVQSCRALCSIIHGIISEKLREKCDVKFPSYKQFI
ncbi:hypothetical protein ACD661_16435 [Legionella lytica]|uniref:Mannitol repressor n=1 Tax=Legionella lytica TaxID=96232 RepID=A0ABW8DBP0_9GAMM